jgi:hypothetical protein
VTSTRRASSPWLIPGSWASAASIFGAQDVADPHRLTGYAWSWNLLNVLRMALTATTGAILFGAYRKLDRRLAGSDARGLGGGEQVDRGLA